MNNIKDVTGLLSTALGERAQTLPQKVYDTSRKWRRSGVMVSLSKSLCRARPHLRGQPGPHDRRGGPEEDVRRHRDGVECTGDPGHGGGPQQGLRLRLLPHPGRGREGYPAHGWWLWAVDG